ncbi:LDL receptor repeat-containing protein egg-2-like [Mya arenaria]|uniref:LDL receptor repeat-containing protein egg-2-like n=1 Tax=Mya arenaria TaxID=6604 RepID=UPI0022E97A86|nr:LDL receptor repeat-containing protein egg-2-like [Mya arenaria]
MSPLVLFVVVSLVTTALAHPNHQVNQRKKTMPQKKPMKMPPQMPISIRPDECEGQFVCAGGSQFSHPECIAGPLVCDGRPDCSGGQDETNCPPTCSPNQILCSDKMTCGTRCDKIPDCPLAEDEKSCPKPCFCDSGLFLCKDGETCLPMSKICNGENDCPGGEDEADCSPECLCGETKYLCEGGKCIDRELLCNGVNDCELGDDEDECPDGCKCNEKEYLCLGGEKCVPQTALCEETAGPADCPFGDDDMCGQPAR